MLASSCCGARVNNLTFVTVDHHFCSYCEQMCELTYIEESAPTDQ